jgi:hypothetical protein
MTTSPHWAALALFPLLFVLGCADRGSPPADKEAKIRAALSQLDPQDQQLAQEQEFCAIESENRLGAMGKPVKLTIKDQPVFLCCKGCAERAQANPDKTLAKVEELKAAHAGSKRQ